MTLLKFPSLRYFASALSVPGDFQDPPDADVSSESEDEDVEPQSRDGKTFLVEFEKSLNWSFVPDASPT